MQRQISKAPAKHIRDGISSWALHSGSNILPLDNPTIVTSCRFPVGASWRSSNLCSITFQRLFEPAVRLMESLVRLPAVRSDSCGKMTPCFLMSYRRIGQPILAIRTRQRHPPVRPSASIPPMSYMANGSRSTSSSWRSSASILEHILSSVAPLSGDDEPPSSCKRRHIGSEPE